MLQALYEFYLKHPEALGVNQAVEDALEQRVLDYIAGMTDRFAIEMYKRYLLPHPYQPFPMHQNLTSAPVELHSQECVI